VVLGSQNFDWRALEHIHEVGVRVRDARVAHTIGEAFEWDWKAADDQKAGRDSTGARVRASAPRGGWRARSVRLVQSPGDTVEVWPSYTPRGFIPDSTLWDRDAIVRLLDAARREVVVQLLTYSIGGHRPRRSTLPAAPRRAARRRACVPRLVS